VWNVLLPPQLMMTGDDGSDASRVTCQVDSIACITK